MFAISMPPQQGEKPSLKVSFNILSHTDNWIATQPPRLEPFLSPNSTVVLFEPALRVSHREWKILMAN